MTAIDSLDYSELYRVLPCSLNSEDYYPLTQITIDNVDYRRVRTIRSHLI